MSNLGSVFGTASVGRLFDLLGLTRVMAVAYILGALFVAAIGFSAYAGMPAMAAAAAFLGCLCIGGASAGAITLSASIYPTALRSTGVGSAMAIARAAQVGSALMVGQLLAANRLGSQIFGFMGILVLIAAAAVLVLGLQHRAQPEGDQGLS
jgi:MFS family permease